jgi:hypothetical protein
LTTESFYYIFLRGSTEKAEFSGFMGGGIPVFNRRQCSRFLLSLLYLADNSSSTAMNVLTFLDEGTKLGLHPEKSSLLMIDSKRILCNHKRASVSISLEK